MTSVDAFAGCGGASLGLRRAGYAHLACIERSPAAVATLRSAGFPAIEADVRDVDFGRWAGAVDLLWASPPCQPGSQAGLRRGAADERDGWPLLLDAVDACRPTWLLAENVLGWGHHDALCGGQSVSCPACHLDRVAAGLAERFAFTGAWHLDAADFGVPQRRRRLILWGGPLPLRPSGPPRTHAHPDLADDLGLRRWVTMGDSIGTTLHRGSCDRRACYPCDVDHGRACSEPGRLARPAPTVTTVEVKGTRANAPSGWSFHGGPDRASDAAFLVAGIRRIDVAEGMRLQGLPDDWPIQGTVEQRYAQVGNAVPPPVAQAAGREVMHAHAVWSVLRARNADVDGLTAVLRRQRAVVATRAA